MHSVSCQSSNMVACVVTTLRFSRTVAVQITPAVWGLASRRPCCSGNKCYCRVFFIFADFQPESTTVWPATIIRSCTACECGLVLEGAQWNIIHIGLQTISGQLFLASSLDLRCSKVYHTTYRETNKQPKLQLAELQLQQAVALLTFTAQCLSLIRPLLFFLLVSLKANNSLISWVVSTSLQNVFNDKGNFRQITGIRTKICFM